jgi:lysine-arginine-ornithine-binding protein
VKKLLKTIGLLSFAAISFSASAAKELKIGTECTYAPFTYRDAQGVIQGYDVDIAREVAKRMNREAVFVCQPFDSSIPALKAKKFDILFTALSVTEERMKTMSFSVPYRSSTGRFAAFADQNIELYDASGKPNPDALKGKVLGLQRSSTYDKYVSDTFPGVKVQRYDTVNNMILDLRSKRVDLIMGGPVVLSTNLMEKEDGSKFKFVGPEIDNPNYFGIGIAAGMRKGDDQLKQEVDAALQSMFADGTFKEINLKYWNFSVLPSVWQ